MTSSFLGVQERHPRDRQSSKRRRGGGVERLPKMWRPRVDEEVKLGRTPASLRGTAPNARLETYIPLWCSRGLATCRFRESRLGKEYLPAGKEGAELGGVSRGGESRSITGPRVWLLRSPLRTPPSVFPHVRPSPPLSSHSHSAPAGFGARAKGAA
ncbi:hypothetical protein LY76DRAFT_112972 [Colletotrichum caudatum]|nr:hypothetical protein LY76DRAFT_112972 [Colletotrichum caudatum]